MSASSFGRALRTTARAVLLALTALIPFFTLPFSLDAFELPKQTLFLVGVTASAVCLLAAATIERQASIRTSLFFLPPVVLLCALILSASLSSSPYLSWLGGQGQIVSSTATLIGCVLYIFCLLQVASDERSRMWLLYGWMFGGFIALFLGVLWIFGVYPLRALGIEAVSGNPIGTMNALGCFVGALSAAASAVWVSVEGKRSALLRVGALGILVASTLFLVCLDYGSTWTIFFLGQGVILLAVFIRPDRAVAPTRLLLPFLLLATSLPFALFLRSPVAGLLPSDVTPSISTSLAIATDAIAKDPWFGMGPNTYQLVYAAHHSSEINATPFWDVHFDRASSYALTLLATIGLVGSGMWLLVFLSGILCVLLHLRPRSVVRGGELAAMGILTACIGAVVLYPYTFTLLLAFFLAFTLLLFSFTKEVTFKTDTPRRHAFLVFITVFSTLFLLFLLFLAVQRLVSEAAFARAIRADRQNAPLQEVVASLDRSASLNRFDDAHYRVLSEALLLRAGEELKRLNTTSSATDEERAYAQALIGASVNASVRATELAPESSQNWLTRGRVYRELIEFSGKDAVRFAREAFARAHALEPNSPVPLFESGVTERMVADVALRLASGGENADAKAQADTALSASETFFLQSLALKPDYAPSVFQLSFVYERQGKLNEAISNMERITIQSPNDLGAIFELGVLYLRRGAEGDATRARTAFTQTLTLAPSFSNARWFLASALEREGKREEAIATLQQILRYDPENQIVKTRIERLKKSTTVEPLPQPIF